MSIEFMIKLTITEHERLNNGTYRMYHKDLLAVCIIVSYFIIRNKYNN